MSDYVDFEKYKNAYWTCAIFATTLLGFAFFLTVLIITTPTARPERIAFLFVVTAAGGTHLLLLWMLRRAHKRPGWVSPRR